MALYPGCLEAFQARDNVAVAEASGRPGGPGPWMQLDLLS